MATKAQALGALREMCLPTKAGPPLVSPEEAKACREAIEKAYPHPGGEARKEAK